MRRKITVIRGIIAMVAIAMLTGQILPLLISTDKLPLFFIIIAIAIIATIIFIIAICFIESSTVKKKRKRK